MARAAINMADWATDAVRGGDEAIATSDETAEAIGFTDEFVSGGGGGVLSSTIGIVAGVGGGIAGLVILGWLASKVM